MRAVAANAQSHRADEIVVAPIADAGFAIGRDVGREDVPNGVSTEGRRQKPGRRRIGVTTAAIAGDRQIAAALDLGEILPVIAGRAARGSERRQQQRCRGPA